MSVAARAADDDPLTRVAQIREHLPAADREFLARGRYAGHYLPSRLVSFSTVQSRLVAQFHLPDELVRQFVDPHPLTISLEGSPHLWSLHRRKAGTLDPGLSQVVLTCYAPNDTSGPFNRFMLSSDGNGVIVSAARIEAQATGLASLILSQGQHGLSVRWRLDLNQWKPGRLDLADLGQLAAGSPELMTTYLLPVLRRLGAATPASDVYRVFDQIPADPRVVARLQPLLARLDAPDPRDREAAASALRTTGRAGVLACLRLDESTLSPEQRSRLTNLYAGEGWLRIDDPEAARRDVGFLSACLEDEDPAVRFAASNTLAGVRTTQQLQR